MSDQVTVAEAAKAMAQSKALLAAIIAAFTLMSGVGLAILEWRVDVNVKNALASQDIGTDSKIVDMDKNIASNAAKAERNAEVIEDNKKRVEQAFSVLLDRE